MIQRAVTIAAHKMRYDRCACCAIFVVACISSGAESLTSPPQVGMFPLQKIRSRQSLRGRQLAFNFPSSDDPDNAFGGQGAAEDDSTPPQQGISIFRVLSSLARTALAHPKETGYVVAGATAGYSVIKLRQKLRQGWPIPLQEKAPHFTFLRPKHRYMKGNYFPSMLKSDFNLSPTGITRDLDAPPPGFRVVKESIVIGAGAGDYEVAARAMRAWRMIDAQSWLHTFSSQDANARQPSESLAIFSRTAAGYVVGPWRVAYAQEGALPEKKGRSTGVHSTVGLSTLSGNCFEGEVRFRVEWHHDASGDEPHDDAGEVRFEVLSLVRRAAGASWVSAPYYAKLHKEGLEGMLGRMAEIVQTEQEMLAMRRARQSAVDVTSRDEKAAIAKRALQRQQDLEELKAKEWHRNNSGYGAGAGGFRPETMSRMRKMQHD